MGVEEVEKVGSAGSFILVFKVEPTTKMMSHGRGKFRECVDLTASIDDEFVSTLYQIITTLILTYFNFQFETKESLFKIGEREIRGKTGIARL